MSGQDEAADDNLLCYRGSLAQGEENRIGFRRNNLGWNVDLAFVFSSDKWD